MKMIDEIKLKDFQFKLNYKMIKTNSFLYKINRAENNGCAYCNIADRNYFSVAI